jgi:hypothetical protein
MRKAPTKGLTLRVAWKGSYFTTSGQFEAAEYGYVMGLDALDRQTRQMVAKHKRDVKWAVRRRLLATEAPPPPVPERLVVV